MGNKSMTLRCFTVDAFHDLPSRETEVIGASSNLLNVPHAETFVPYARDMRWFVVETTTRCLHLLPL